MDKDSEQQEMSPAEYLKRCKEIINISAEDNSPEERKKYLDELTFIISRCF